MSNTKPMKIINSSLLYLSDLVISDINNPTKKNATITPLSSANVRY